KEGVIKIGWAPSRVRLRVNIIRCYRCLGFGHHSKECTNEDNSSLCINCGKEGHKGKECQNASYCLTCKKEGHRAEQTRCPHYRKLISERTKPMTSGGERRGRPNGVAVEGPPL
ncbi:Zinc knuckle, partial [Popillia japonica]